MGASGRRGLAIVAGGVVGIALAVVQAACATTVFACGADDECADDGQTGTCEATGFCSFPDDECPSGSRYGSHAGDSLAGECVPISDGTTGADDDGPSGGGDTLVLDGDDSDAEVVTDPDPTTSPSGVDDSTTDVPIPMCGDGDLDPGEDCDDDNLVDGDGCNADCTPSGELVWQIVEDGPAGLADGAASIAIGPGDELFVGAWFTTDDAPELAARELTLDGDIAWTTAISSPMPFDSIFAWGIAADEDGNPAIAGDGSSLAGADWVVAQLDGEGQVLWQHQEAGEAYGVAIGANVWACGRSDTGEGRILGYDDDGAVLHRHEGNPAHPTDGFAWDIAVATGEVVVSGTVDTSADYGWAARLMPDGTVIAAIEFDATYSQALALAQATEGWWIVGRSETQDAGWIAGVPASFGMIVGPQTITAAGVTGNVHGVTVGPSGEVVAVGWQVVGGVLEAFVAKFTPEGELAWSRTYDGGTTAADSARDVVVASDGTIVVAGHVGGLGAGDFWVFALTP